MIKKAIEKIVNKKDLTYEEAYAAMNEILGGTTSVIQNAAFLAALSTKGTTNNTVDEICGCAAALQGHAQRVEHGMDVMEIAGTGGDGSSSFNISTTSAFVTAAAGIKVAKHGNRAASSQSGTADCLEALGANISLEPEKCLELLEKTGFCFFFAEKYQMSNKEAVAIRSTLGSRTVFNILDSLTNPASPARYLLGVYAEELVEPLARVLVKLGVKTGMVVFGQDPLDEISLSSPTSACEIKDGYYRTFVIRPEEYGLRCCRREELVGGRPSVNAEITRAILSGTEQGPKRAVVLLNAGAAIYVGGKARDLREGIRIAEECIDSREALRRLQLFVEMSNS